MYHGKFSSSLVFGLALRMVFMESDGGCLGRSSLVSGGYSRFLSGFLLLPDETVPPLVVAAE